MATTSTSVNGEQRVTHVVNVPLGAGRTARLVITINMTTVQVPITPGRVEQNNNQYQQIQQQPLPRLVLRGPLEQHQQNVSDVTFVGVKFVDGGFDSNTVNCDNAAHLIVDPKMDC
ncbi:hypothetical protein QAD02_022728 [Eretmocerus hayati]|uniref:Uncharacterized protein n=1 Tax=Eretmocerus hayati TaxID=131215 RepID=A0ACC2PTL0_9HYME|nr:hypothetical protein QAD02_022728 [Eretmocerus hayati]